MKLDEFQVRHARACEVRERNAVAGRNRGVGRLAKNPAGAARCQQRRGGAHLTPNAAAVDVRDTRCRAAVLQHVRHERVIDCFDRSERVHAIPQHASDFAPRRVACVQNAADAVRRLTAECDRAAAVAIESRPPLDELADVRRSVLDQHPNGFCVAQPVAGAHGIRRMQLRAVVVSDGGGDAALCVTGVALRRIGFREYDDAAG